ncbi:MAG: signal peptidase I [Kineosporiaceae bacterium]
MATPHPPWPVGPAEPDDLTGVVDGSAPANGYRTRRERRAAEAADGVVPWAGGGSADAPPAPPPLSRDLPTPTPPSVPRRAPLPPRPAASRLTGPVQPSSNGSTPWRPGTGTLLPSGRRPLPGAPPDGSAGSLAAQAAAPDRSHHEAGLAPAPRPHPDPGHVPGHDTTELTAPVRPVRSAGPPTHRPTDPAVSAVGALPAPRTAALPTGAHPARPPFGRRLLRDAREVLGTVAIALGIAIVIKTFLIQPFFIPSQSMENTLLIGDRVLVSKLEPGPFELNRGDVAVFVDPGGWLTTETPEPSLVTRALTFVGLLPANSGEHLIKRVVGLPGDTVRCCDPEGRLLVNNQPLDESEYLFPGDSPSILEFEVVVPEGTVWVMGDHRSVSEDSRYHDVDGDFTAGAVPIDNVVGRAVLVMWPLARLDWLGTPDDVFDGVGGQLDGVR